MDPKKDKTPKPDDVKLISFDSQLFPGAIAGQLSINFYALGDDGIIYIWGKDKIWVQFV